MTWTYVAPKNLDSVDEYEADFHRRLRLASNEDAAQRLINEARAWEDFNRAIQGLERRGEDPCSSDFFDVLAEGRKKYHRFFVFKHSPFTIIYFRDAAQRRAVRVLVFHARDQKRSLEELLTLLHEAQES